MNPLGPELIQRCLLCCLDDWLFHEPSVKPVASRGHDGWDVRGFLIFKSRAHSDEVFNYPSMWTLLQYTGQHRTGT